MRNIGFEVELDVPRARRNEKALVVRAPGDEPRLERDVDLVTLLRDARTDGGDDATAARAQRLHRGDGRFFHAADRPLPPGMRRADDTRFDIREEHRRAIGGQDAER